MIKEHKTHTSEGGYNMTYGGDGTLGWNPPQEWRDKISQIVSGKRNPMYGKGLYGKQNGFYKVFGEKNPLSKEYIVTCPDVEEISLIGLIHVARVNGLSGPSLFLVASGKYKHHRGYKVRKIS